MSSSMVEFSRQTPQERVHLMRQFQELLPRIQQAHNGSGVADLLGSCRTIVEACSKLLAVSQGGSTVLYFVTKGMTPTSTTGSEQQPCWYIHHVGTVNTDTTPDDPYQRVVRICRVIDQSSINTPMQQGSLSDFFFFTGGGDGSVKGFALFAVDALNPKQSIKIDPTWSREQLHKEVVSLSVSCDASSVASCGREGRAFILSAVDGLLIKEIPVACVPSESADNSNNAAERRYFCCAIRFHPTQPRELFLAWIPASKYQRSNLPSYIMRLQLLTAKAERGTEQKHQLQIDRVRSLGVQPVHVDGLEVSRDGSMLAVGTRSGDVLQLDTNSLSTRSTSRSPHVAPVNRFLYADNMISGQNTLFTVGIDNTLVMHKSRQNSLLSVKTFFLTWLVASLALYFALHMLSTYNSMPSARKSASSRISSFVPSRIPHSHSDIEPSAAAAGDSSTNDSLLLPPVGLHGHHKHALPDHLDHHDDVGHISRPSFDAATNFAAQPLVEPNVELPHSIRFEQTTELGGSREPLLLQTQLLPSAHVPTLIATTTTAAAHIHAASDDVADTVAETIMPTELGTVSAGTGLHGFAPTGSVSLTSHALDGHHGHDHHGHHDHDHAHDGHDHHHHHHHHHHDKKREYDATLAMLQSANAPHATASRPAAAIYNTAVGYGIRRPAVTTAITATTTTTTAAHVPLQPTTAATTAQSSSEAASTQSAAATTTTAIPEESAAELVENTLTPLVASTTVQTVDATPAPAAAMHAETDGVTTTTTPAPETTTTTESSSTTESIDTSTTSPFVDDGHGTPTATLAEAVSTDGTTTIQGQDELAASSTRTPTVVVDEEPANNASVVVDNAAPLGSTRIDAADTEPVPTAESDTVIVEAVDNSPLPPGTTTPVSADFAGEQHAAADISRYTLENTNPVSSTTQMPVENDATTTAATTATPSTTEDGTAMPTNNAVDDADHANDAEQSVDAESEHRELQEADEVTNYNSNEETAGPFDASVDGGVISSSLNLSLEDLPPIPLPPVSSVSSSTPVALGDASSVVDVVDETVITTTEGASSSAEEQATTMAAPTDDDEKNKKTGLKRFFAGFTDMI